MRRCGVVSGYRVVALLLAGSSLSLACTRYPGQAAREPRGDLRTDSARADLPRADLLVDLRADGILDTKPGEGVPLKDLAPCLPFFTPWQTLDVAPNPERLHLADLSKSGRLDIVVVHRKVAARPGGDSVGIVRHTQSDVFAAEETAGDNPTDAAIADLDGDGTLDLAVTAYDVDYTGGTIALLPGKGTGFFDASLIMSSKVKGIGANPMTVIAVPLGTDAPLDLVVSHNNGAGWPINTFFGNGLGNFSEAQTLPGGQNPQILFAVDVDGDGHLDIVGGTVYTGVRIYINDGNGTLFFKQTLLSGVAHTLAVADVDHDAATSPDIVVAQTNPDRVTLLKNDGLGSFTTEPLADGILKERARYMRLADLDADGWLDVVLIEPTDVVWLLSDRQGSFRPPARRTVGTDLGGLAVGRINGDSRVDVVVSSHDTGKIHILQQLCVP